MSPAVRFPDTHVVKAVMVALIRYEALWAEEGSKVENVRRVTLGLQFNEDSDDDVGAKIIIDFPNNGGAVFSIVKEQQERARDNFVQLALANHLILDNIFSHGSFDDLKNFRLVNEKWDEVASGILSTKRVLIRKAEIFKELDLIPWTGGVFQRRTELISGAFDELTSVITGSRGFIGNSIKIDTDLWELPNASISKFLKLHGKAIKYIKLNYRSSDAQSLQTIYKLLTEDLCNVREIYVKDLYVHSTRNQVLKTIAELSAGVPRLQNLVKITFASSLQYFTHADGFQGFFRGVIMEAPKLTSIVNLPCKLIKAVVEGGKASIVKNVCLGCYSSDGDYRETFACLEDLISSGLPLLSLSLPKKSVPQGSRDFWARLLEAKKDTLRSLRVTSVTNPLQIPTLTQVEHLHLQLGPSALFATGFKFSTCFPNLRTVHLTLDCPFDVPSCFPQDDFQNNIVEVWTSPVVMDTTLGNIDRSRIIPLFMKFPNISTVTIDCYEYEGGFDFDPSVVDTSMWSCFSNVESLRFADVMYQGLSPHELDSVLTGIPEEMCPRLLKEYSSRSPTELELTLLLNQASINDLKNLKDLSIELTAHRLDYCDPVVPLISMVSAWCGFQLNPNLHVSITYDASEADSQEIAEILSPLSNVVTIKKRWGTTAED